MITHDDEGQAPRIAFNVTNQRVQHYDDIVEYWIRSEITRCKERDKFSPSIEQINFFRKELIRYAIIRGDVKTASMLHIRNTGILNEANNLDSWSKLYE